MARKKVTRLENRNHYDQADLDRAILTDSAMQARILQHQHARVDCVLCGGPYYTVTMYYDPQIIDHGGIHIMLCSICQPCSERDDLLTLIAEEYHKDLAKARQQYALRRNAHLN